MADEDELIVYTDGAVRHIRFNRPQKLNAMTLRQHERVIEAVRAAEKDGAVRVIAFSGEGKSFCAGDDLKQTERVWPERYRKRLVDLDIGIGPLLLQEATAVIRYTRKPTVALMHGYAIGAGYDYATSCDFRVATVTCLFGDPRVHRALWAAEGWSYKLTRLVPQGYATKIALLGELLSGEEAHRIGLVHRVYPDGIDIRESARDFLLGVSRLDGETFATIKRQILDGLDLRYESALAHCVW